jgi:hypothetical protein
MPSTRDRRTNAVSDRPFIALAAALLIMSAACGATPTTATPPVQQLQIVGIPASVAKGASIPLRAVIVSGHVQEEDCAGAQWAIDDGNVAKISSQGVLTGLLTGFANVTVTCRGLTSSARARVEGPVGRPWVYGRDVQLFSLSCGAVGGSCRTVPDVTIDFLDGPRAGERHSQSDLPGMSGLVLPITIRASARFYGTAVFVLAESTAGFNNGHDAIWTIAMTYVGDSLTDTYIDVPYHRDVRRPFATRGPGTVEVGTFWLNGDPTSNEVLAPELWCGGQLLQRVEQRNGHSGITISQSIAEPTSCEVRASGYGGTQYRLTITYPH